jgi:ankyrin repeat protein
MTDKEQYRFKYDKMIIILIGNINIYESIKVAKLIESFDDIDYIINFINNNTTNNLLNRHISGYINNNEYPFMLDIFGFACFFERYEIIKALLETKLYDINHSYKIGDSYQTPIMMNFDNIKVLKLLIDNGADLNLKDQDGRSAFSESCYHGDVECCKLMYDTGKCSFDEKILIDKDGEKQTCGEFLLAKIFLLQKIIGKY